MRTIEELHTDTEAIIQEIALRKATNAFILLNGTDCHGLLVASGLADKELSEKLLKPNSRGEIGYNGTEIRILESRVKDILSQEKRNS